jgi:phenylpropionate dioxygenase-like ring-hydroxylating dioxygenase large terminal subunit
MKIPNNQWHPILLSSELPAGKPVRARRFGLDLAFWRDSTGAPSALADACPHLGASLSQGAIVNGRLACPLHGFEFEASGACSHIPAVGASGKIPAGLSCSSHACKESHGVVWMWMGDQPAHGAPSYFSAEIAGLACSDTTAECEVNYSRAVENQLDVAHLAFAHKSTIGAGGRDFVDGPLVEQDESGLQAWVFNSKDPARASRSQEELRADARGRPPSLRLLFPGQWLLHISERLKNVVLFVPVDENRTRYYIRAYRKPIAPLVDSAYGWALGLSNRFILNQDLRLIERQTPRFSPDALSERHIGADRALLAYRRWLAANLYESDPAARAAFDPGRKTIPIAAAPGI